MLSLDYELITALVQLISNIAKGFSPLPKSITPSRIEENADIYDFELTEDDMKVLDTGKYEPCSWDPTVSRD
jgi:diketogulonate reductase-like aldo/keto reductase